MKKVESIGPSVGGFYCGEFKQGSRYRTRRPEGREDWLLIYTAGGSGLISTRQGSHVTESGDVFLFSPGESQDYGTAPSVAKWHLMWAHFLPRAHWLIWLAWPRTAPGLKLLRLRDEVRSEFSSALRNMIRLSRRKIPGHLDLAANALESALLWANVAVSKDKWLSMDPRVRQAIDYLVANLEKPFGLDDLARICGLSVSRLAHLFREQTGSSPQRFLELHRMRHAMQLLRLTSLNVTEIAAEVGYADPFYFSNRFRRHTGRSPSEFRRADHA